MAQESQTVRLQYGTMQYEAVCIRLCPGSRKDERLPAISQNVEVWIYFLCYARRVPLSRPMIRGPDLSTGSATAVYTLTDRRDRLEGLSQWYVVRKRPDPFNRIGKGGHDAVAKQARHHFRLCSVQPAGKQCAITGPVFFCLGGIV